MVWIGTKCGEMKLFWSQCAKMSSGEPIFGQKMEQNGGLLKMGILGSDPSKEVRQVLQVVGSDSSLRNSFLRRSSNYPITISVQQVM